MPRYRLTLEYDGTNFVGWQRQAIDASVQACLEAAIERYSGEPAAAVAAGRTDAGVHALGQVVHVDMARSRACDEIRDAVNFHLRPDPIAVLDVAETAPAFHARFAAIRRAYRYRIVNRRAPLTVDRNRAWRVVPPLDAEAMQLAARCLLGRHDFTSFRSA